ncbi:MAG: DUF192 domain-containing protein [Candidatus Nucleicultricaceae bacterium]
MNTSFKRLFLGFFFLISLTPSMLLARCGCKKIEKIIIETALKQTPFKIEVASTPQALKKGLMFRREIAEDEGMLFVMASPGRARFWMQNTYISLDLLFLNEYGIIVEIMKDATPLSEKRLVSAVDTVKAVLEVPAGTAQKLHLSVGDRVRHPIFKTVSLQKKQDCKQEVNP